MRGMGMSCPPECRGWSTSLSTSLAFSDSRREKAGILRIPARIPQESRKTNTQKTTLVFTLPVSIEILKITVWCQGELTKVANYPSNALTAKQSILSNHDDGHRKANAQVAVDEVDLTSLVLANSGEVRTKVKDKPCS